MNTNISALALHLKEMEAAEQVAAEMAQLEEIEGIFSGYQVGLEELSSIQIAVENPDISEEALVGFFGKIGETILSIGNTFKTLVLKGGNRSELRFIYEQNTIQINRLESKSIADYVDVEVDVPTGMKGTYPEAASVISESYGSLDMLATIQSGVRVMDTVLSSLSKGSTTHEREVDAANKILEGKLKRQETSLKALRKVFPGKGEALKQYPISKMVNSFEELKAVRLSLMALEQQLLSVTKIHNFMENMAKSCELAAEFAKDNTGEGGSSDHVPSSKFLGTLSRYLGNNAKALTNFSEIVNVHMATEHNLGLAYTKLLSI